EDRGIRARIDMSGRSRTATRAIARIAIVALAVLADRVHRCVGKHFTHVPFSVFELAGDGLFLRFELLNSQFVLDVAALFVFHETGGVNHRRSRTVTAIAHGRRSQTDAILRVRNSRKTQNGECDQAHGADSYASL